MSASGGKLRLLLIEPDAELRQGLMRRLAQHAFVEVVGEARSFATAMPRVAGLQPDWVVAGLGRDTEQGVEFLRELAATRTRCSFAAILPAGLRTSLPDLLGTMRNLGTQAIVRLPDGRLGDDEIDRLGGELLAQVLRVASNSPRSAPQRPHDVATAMTAPPATAAAAPAPSPAANGVGGAPRITPSPRVARSGRWPSIVGIGVSTGGPSALATMLPELPADFPLPIVIVQHMPPQFTKGLAESLSRTCRLPVAEAQNGEPVQPGRILIAPGGRHLRVVRRDGAFVTELTDDAPECSCRPSVDYLFRSLVALHGAQVLGVVLTGMGEDGWVGSRLIAAAGGAVLAQDEASCTVYGMPRGPIQEGIAEAVPLQRMAGRIVTSVGGVPCS